MNRLLSLTGGLPFVALSPERAAAFLLPSMARPSTSPGKKLVAEAFPLQCVSVEAREGISTGISAADRALTVAILGAPTPQPRKLVKPGHIFPVETREGGVLVKMSIPEAALDLVTLSGFSDAALYMDLLGSDGAYMSEAATRELSATHKLPVITLTALVEYRLEQEPLISKIAEANLPTQEAGDVRAIIYRSKIHDVEHVALVKGDVSTGAPVLVRVQSENTIADVFGGGSPPSREHLKNSLRLIGARGAGVLLYLRRSSLLMEQSAKSQAHGNTSLALPASLGGAMMMREYGVGAQILRNLGVNKIELLTGTTRSMAGLSSFGIDIVSQHSISDYK
jgi:3,4-dihydroxy 2-butanone 4-phosphate synthase/GTP cyclohydrolase II